MEPVHITYRIKLSEKVTEVFDFSLDGKTFELIDKQVADPPKWAELGYRQCSHCPLKSAEHTHCPMALQLHNVVSRFHKSSSIDEVELEVITDDRRVIQKTALQRVIASMLSLVYPICGCPKTAYMRPLARFHLPLSSEEETVFNVTGMYLLAQYFLNNTGKKGQFDFDGLTKIYEDMHILNVAVASRLQGMTDSDSVKNAITLVDMYSTLVPMLIEDQLAEMRTFFRAYLPAGDAPASKHNYLEKAKAFTLELIPTAEEMKMAEEKAAHEKSAQEKADKEKAAAGGGVPDWLKEVRPEKNGVAEKAALSPETKPAAPEAAEAKPATPEPMITASGLSLSLEPIGAEKSVPGVKASFDLPAEDKAASTGFFRPLKK